MDEIVGTARALGLSTTVEPRPRNAVRVKVFGGLTSLLLPAWCGHGAKSKKVPGFVFHAGREMRQHFLDGLYLGDGHRVKTREVLMLTSASRALVEDVEVLWLLQGVVPSRKGPFHPARPGPPAVDVVEARRLRLRHRRLARLQAT